MASRLVGFSLTSASSGQPRFSTLPPRDYALRSARIDTAVREAFAAKATPPHPATCCPACTFPINVRERIARTADGRIYHAGCARSAP